MATILTNCLKRTVIAQTRALAVAGPSAVSGHAGGGYKLWRNMSFFVALPAIALCMLNAYLSHQEDHHKPRPEFVPYEHLRIRNKRFPWGDGQKSLFHNAHVNALPEGYEDGH